jgi:hypothetical protein
MLRVLVIALHAAHGDLAGLRAVAESGQVRVVDNDEWRWERREVLLTDRRCCTPVCTGHSLWAGGCRKTGRSLQSVCRVTVWQRAGTTECGSDGAVSVGTAGRNLFVPFCKVICLYPSVK